MKQDKWKQLPIKILRGVRQSCSLSFVLLKDYAGRRSKGVNKCQALIEKLQIAIVSLVTVLIAEDDHDLQKSLSERLGSEWSILINLKEKKQKA